MYMRLGHCSVTNAGLDNLPCKAADFTFPLQPVNDHDKPLAHGEHHSQMLAAKLKNIPEVLAILETVLPAWCPIFQGEQDAAELGANSDANHTCTKFS